MPGRLQSPETLNNRAPGDFSVPIDENHSGPFSRMQGTHAKVSTLLTTVGNPK